MMKWSEKCLCLLSPVPFYWRAQRRGLRCSDGSGGTASRFCGAWGWRRDSRAAVTDRVRPTRCTHRPLSGRAGGTDPRGCGRSDANCGGRSLVAREFRLKGTELAPSKH
jgi:hypothetical protein